MLLPLLMSWIELSDCVIGDGKVNGEPLPPPPGSSSSSSCDTIAKFDYEIGDGGKDAMSLTRGCETMLHRFHLVNRRLVASEVVGSTICKSIEEVVLFINNTLPAGMPKVSSFRVGVFSSLLNSSTTSTTTFSSPQTVFLRRLVSKVPKVRPTIYDIVIASCFNKSDPSEEIKDVLEEDGYYYISLSLQDSGFTPCFKIVLSGQLKDGHVVKLLGWLDGDTNAPMDAVHTINKKDVMDDTKVKSKAQTTQKREYGSHSTASNLVYPPCISWLKEKMFPKFVEWYTSDANSVLSQWRCSNEERRFTMTQFAEKYQEIKDKYAITLIDNWPETTDPLKFVFEELAIAAYMCLTFEHAPSSALFQRKFVDLGCGNGLLTYILTKEGYNGYGVDVRSRKLWEWFGPSIDLREHTVTPNKGSTFPDCEWLLGNHSDELTPWLPIMCTLTSPHQRMWVLPCCPFELGGGKHDAQAQYASQYDSYLHHIKNICADCGLSIVSDVLRIPSTKRICFTGVRENENEVMDKNIEAAKAYFEEGQSFKKRAKVQIVRNCTGLPRSFLDECISLIAAKLLDMTDTRADIIVDGKTISWKLGGELMLPDVAKLLGGERLKRLKSECGGVKTLLRNHRQIFEVKKKSVAIRRWDMETLTVTPKKTKERPCWFFLNHPDGCPKTLSNCPFLHGEDDCVDNFKL
eukprot:m.41288 g.41288  ORF g.41288 m.41288 type:complete len:688 (-) comp6992_c0_seq1:2610-4673(-)